MIVHLRKQLTKIIIKQISGFENINYLQDFLELIPDDFSGSLLILPLGKDELSLEKYLRLKQANIATLINSESQAKELKKDLERSGISNVQCEIGTTEKLPFQSDCFDLVISINGFHQFARKDIAFNETARVLRKSGKFCACFYVKGESGLSDFFVKQISKRRPQEFKTPFYTASDIETKLKTLFSSGDIHLQKSIVLLKCTK